MITTQIFEQPHFSYRGRTSAPLIAYPHRLAIAGLMTTGFIARAAFDLGLMLGGLALPFIVIGWLGT